MDKKGDIKAVSDIQQKEIFLKNYWKAVLEQDEKTLPEFFREDALIRWHNTDRHGLRGQGGLYPGRGDKALREVPAV